MPSKKSKKGKRGKARNVPSVVPAAPAVVAVGSAKIPAVAWMAGLALLAGLTSFVAGADWPECLAIALGAFLGVPVARVGVGGATRAVTAIKASNLLRRR